MNYIKENKITKDNATFYINKIDIKDLSNELWKQLHSLFEEEFHHLNPKDPLPSRNLRETSMTKTSKDWDLHRWLILSENKESLLGYASIFYPNKNSISFEESRSNVDMYIGLFKKYRRKGIGTEILKVILEMMGKLKRNTIQADFSTAYSKSFALKMGFEILVERNINRLYLEDVDWTKISKWRECKAKDEGVTLELFENIPEKYLIEYCNLYTETGRQAPDYDGDYIACEQVSPETRRENEKTWHERGIRCLTFVSREKDGKLSGMTEIFSIDSAKHYLEQELTGVLRNYRKRGIGKWLKAEMLFYVKEHFPETKFLETGNALKNGPMLKINNEIGFKAHLDHYLVKAKIDHVRRAIMQ